MDVSIFFRRYKVLDLESIQTYLIGRLTPPWTLLPVRCVVWLVGRLVCHNFLKGWEDTLLNIN